MYRKNDLAIPVFKYGPCLCPCLGSSRSSWVQVRPRQEPPSAVPAPAFGLFRGGSRVKGISQAAGRGAVGNRTPWCPLKLGCSRKSFSSGVSCVWLVYGYRASTRAARAGRCAARILRKGEAYRPSPMRPRLTLRMLNSVDTKYRSIETRLRALRCKCWASIRHLPPQRQRRRWRYDNPALYGFHRKRHSAARPTKRGVPAPTCQKDSQPPTCSFFRQDLWPARRRLRQRARGLPHRPGCQKVIHRAGNGDAQARTRRSPNVQSHTINRVFHQPPSQWCAKARKLKFDRSRETGDAGKKWTMRPGEDRIRSTAKCQYHRADCLCPSKKREQGTPRKPVFADERALRLIAVLGRQAAPKSRQRGIA